MAEVIGVFESSHFANEAVRDLVENIGIDRDQISIVAREEDRRDSAAAYGDRATQEGGSSGAAKGAGVGAVIGGAGGLLVGIAGLAIPGIGPIIAAGPIATALTAVLGGAGIGAVTGGLIGALTDIGVPESEARRYEHAVGEGRTLVTVHTGDRGLADRVARVLDDHGAIDLDHDEHAGPFVPSERPPYDRGEIRRQQVGAERGDGTERELHDDEAITVPVTEEKLVLGKRTVPSARVRVYSRVSEKPVAEQISLREEHVDIDRRKVDRPVRATDRPADEVVVEVTAMKEEPVTGKEERVVEEIVISKSAEERTKTVRDKVKRREVEVDRNDSTHRPTQQDASEHRTHDQNRQS